MLEKETRMGYDCPTQRGPDVPKFIICPGGRGYVWQIPRRERKKESGSPPKPVSYQ
jgi:hypothetical protein